MRAILIDPHEHRIAQVEYTGTLENIYEHIDSNVFEPVAISLRDYLLVDEEGKLPHKLSGQAYFYIDTVQELLAGRALVVGCSRSKEIFIATTITIDSLLSRITFITKPSGV